MKDQPVTVQSAAGRPRLDVLPEWPISTIGMLSTVDDGPHEIPVTAPVRVGDRQIMFTLKHSRGSLARLRENPQVALLILSAGDVAFTARGRARILEERMESAPDFAAVVLDVENIDDHRQATEAVESGIGIRWADEDPQRALHERVAALRELAGRRA